MNWLLVPLFYYVALRGTPHLTDSLSMPAPPIYHNQRSRQKEKMTYTIFYIITFYTCQDFDYFSPKITNPISSSVESCGDGAKTVITSPTAKFTDSPENVAIF